MILAAMPLASPSCDAIPLRRPSQIKTPCENQLVVAPACSVSAISVAGGLPVTSAHFLICAGGWALVTVSGNVFRNDQGRGASHTHIDQLDVSLYDVVHEVSLRGTPPSSLLPLLPYSVQVP
jgi:hypothetical protein